MALAQQTTQTNWLVFVMSARTIVTTQETREVEWSSWDVACGQAVRDALAGVVSVIVVDEYGGSYYIDAEPVEDNS
jgi:hypothetical protein